MSAHLHARAHQLAQLYYAAELAARSGEVIGIPGAIAGDILNAAGELYDHFTADLVGLDDPERAAAGAAALGELRRVSKERARYYIGATALMHVPDASSVAEAAREAHREAFGRSSESIRMQLDAMRKLTDMLTGS